jgi:hypothetical protein
VESGAAVVLRVLPPSAKLSETVAVFFWRRSLVDQGWTAVGEEVDEAETWVLEAEVLVIRTSEREGSARDGFAPLAKPDNGVADNAPVVVVAADFGSVAEDLGVSVITHLQGCLRDILRACRKGSGVSIVICQYRRNKAIPRRRRQSGRIRRYCRIRRSRRRDNRTRY